MENKNILIAVILSSVVLLLWAVLFEPPPTPVEMVEEKTITKKENSDLPSVENSNVNEKISRDITIKKTDRILLKNIDKEEYY